MEDERVAVVVPGVGYSAQGPLLAYTSLAVQRRGAQARAISWSPPALQEPAQWIAWVRERVLEVLDSDTSLIIGKSLGSMAAGLAAEWELPAIWLTPLLHRLDVAEAIGASPRPALLVGGTADRTWDGALARRISRHVLEIPDADHALYVPGPVSRTAAVAGQVAAAVEEFLDHYVWPPAAQSDRSSPAG